MRAGREFATCRAHALAIQENFKGPAWAEVIGATTREPKARNPAKAGKQKRRTASPSLRNQTRTGEKSCEKQGSGVGQQFCTDAGPVLFPALHFFYPFAAAKRLFTSAQFTTFHQADR